MSDSVSVTVFDDGPMKISNAQTFTFGEQVLETDGDVYLCRCGQTANAPFCDGSHKRVGFDGGCENPPSKEVRVWEGNTVRTFFNPNTCMHVFFCKPLKELRARELAGDAAAAQEIVEVVNSCPSGALSYEAKGALDAPAAPDRAVDVAIVEGGEVRIQCAYSINATRMERQPDTRATLCRCGQSMNKPWCDGRHKTRTDFR